MDGIRFMSDSVLHPYLQERRIKMIGLTLLAIGGGLVFICMCLYVIKTLIELIVDGEYILFVWGIALLILMFGLLFVIVGV